MFNKALRLILFFSFAVIAVHAQNLSKSPYSSLGMGDLQFGGNALQSAMGQTAQGLRKTSDLNNQNPASYGGLKFTVLEAGFKFSSGTIMNSAASSNVYNASYGYLGIGLPVSQKLRWGLSFGLQPVSSTGYNVASYVDYGEFPATLQSSGRGGLSKFYVGTGIALFKNLSVGINASYLWGQLSSTKSIYIDPNVIANNVFRTNTEIARTTYIGDIYFDYGVQYHKIIKEKYKLVIGSTVNMATPLAASQDYTARTLGVGGILSSKDTVVSETNKKGSLQLPFIIRTGFSLEEQDHWTICADVNYANWSTYRSFNATDSLKNTIGVSIGASFIPRSTDYKNYLKRIEYRAGARYDNGYLNIYGTDIATYGVSAGLGLPLGKSRSRLNLSAEYFVRGTTSKPDLIGEQYWRFILGITFTDKWFIRYKYE